MKLFLIMRNTGQTILGARARSKKSTDTCLTVMPIHNTEAANKLVSFILNLQLACINEMIGVIVFNDLLWYYMCVYDYFSFHLLGY